MKTMPPSANVLEEHAPHDAELLGPILQRWLLERGIDADLRPAEPETESDANCGVYNSLVSLGT